MTTLDFDGETITNSRHELAVAFLLAIETAMRQGELWNLTWDDVFLDKRYVHVGCGFVEPWHWRPRPLLGSKQS